MNELTLKITENLNEAQRKAVENPINSCTKIVAGAGTGKTKIISKRFTKLSLDLLNEKVENPSSHILVITFTEKAANEMKTRILEELTQNGMNSYGGELWISTFHGFCSKILRKHSIEALLSPDFSLADDSTLEEVKNNIIKALKYGEYNELNNFSKICGKLGLDENILSISQLKKLSSIAPIDSVFEDIFYVIKKIKSLGLTPKEFLEKTLSATTAFSSNVESLPFGFEKSTDYVIAWENHLKPYMDSFCRFQEKEAFASIVKDNILVCKNRGKTAKAWTPAEGFPEIVKTFGEAEIYVTKITALIYSIYQNELRERNLVDFDDLINKTLEILKNNSVIRTYYQKFFRHLIIDEFQDTNGSQLELIKLLLSETEPNITFVGDRKQSIYGFRHAQTENLEELHKFIEQKYSQKYPEIKLEINYRSTPHVLNAVNHVTLNSLELAEVLRANPLPQIPFDTENKYVLETEITDFENADNRRLIEAKYIASEIQRLHRLEKAEYKDFAVLVKSHFQSELIEKILTDYGIPAVKKTNKSFFNHSAVKNAICALRLARNPYDEIALTGLLKVGLTDYELYELKKSIDYDYFNSDIKTTEKKANFCEKIIFLYENNSLKPQILLNIFDTVHKILKEKSTLSLLNIFYELEQNIPLFKECQSIEAYKSEQNLRIFEKIITDFEHSKNYVTIANLLDYFEKIAADKSFELPSVTSGEINAVQLLTIHASKGLEFPYTFVAGISSELSKTHNRITFDLQYGSKPGFGLIIEKMNNTPSPKGLLYKELWKKPRELNEQIRLFYVAVSRAVKYLNIISFTPGKYSKPAEYSMNFPDFVIKNLVRDNDITIEKQNIEYKFTSAKKQIPKAQSTQKAAIKNNYSFSFSRLNTFKKCRNKFLLKYKYKFPSLKSKNDAGSIGSIVHKLIYTSYIYKKEFSEDAVAKFSAGCDVSENDSTRILNLYKAFAASSYCPSKLSTVYFSEMNVSFNFELSGKNIEFNGDIDLLIENPDNTYTIVDFKTHENLEKVKDDYLKQLFIYKKACEAEGKSVKKAILLNLKEDGTAPAIVLENEQLIEEEIKDMVESAIEYMEKQNHLEEINYDECAFCDYKYICK